jgi:putative glutamine amidotransferase
MARPVIGVTCSVGPDEESPSAPRTFLNMAYTDAIFAAGGMPQPLPPPADVSESILDEMLSRCDGLLFTGGADVNPRQYGKAAHAKTHVMHDRRDAFDIELFRRADQLDKPILSICLGCQIASVARGGCLIQHVDDMPRKSSIEHHKPGGKSAYHDIEVVPGTRLEKILGCRKMEVNSRHHQVVDEKSLGGRLKAAAFAPDGVVEAAEDPAKRFLIAVQWHPEDLIDRPEHLALFNGLVLAASLKS